MNTKTLKPSKRVVMSLLFMIMLTMSSTGCSTLKQDPYGELRLTQEVFLTAVISATDLYDAGQIAPDEVATLTRIILQGQEYLIAWQAAIEANQEYAAIIAGMQVVIEELTSYGKDVN